MRLVHSFSTARCRGEKLREHVYYFALSALYAKQSGFDIVLHTDELGAELLKPAPYDEIFVDLKDCVGPKRIYAWPKFHAMAAEGAGNIHIDGDVFLKKPLLKKLLTFDDCDLIVQSIEVKGVNGWGYLWDESTQAFARCEYPAYMQRDCRQMYNCGVVGFRDSEMQRLYHQGYAMLIEQYEEKGIDLCSVPDLIAEQQLLYDFAKYHRLKVKTLLSFPDLTSSADGIGYQHVIGGAKGIYFDRCKQTLEMLNNGIFKKLEGISWDI